MKTCPVCDTPYPEQHITCPTDGAVLLQTSELPPGHLLRGKYRVVRLLGRGGMGVVYLSEHILLGGHLALKFLAPELSRNPQFVKRFRNEARAAYQLHHPNIVEVMDLDQDEDGTLFIAMEYVAGPSLRTVLREAKGPISASRTFEIARGVASGLAAAHARGSVHRDIKPENILLAMDQGGKLQAKILDFGIAAIADNITGLSHTRGLLLTPEYAAPEQWRGMAAADLDGRTDLYALGGVLYEMLSGRTPFRAGNAEGWMYQHLQCVPQPLGELCPEFSGSFRGFDAIVMRLLAREREQRFESASALLEALDHMQAGSATGPTVAAGDSKGLAEISDRAAATLPQLAPVVPELTVAGTAGSTAETESDEAGGEPLPSSTLPVRKSRQGQMIFAAAATLCAMVAVSWLIWFSQHRASGPGPASTPAQQAELAEPAAPHELTPADKAGSQPNRPSSPSPAQEAKPTSGESSELAWTDHATGFMWTKKSTGANLTWSQAVEHCRSLQLAGYSGWVLPTPSDLDTISGASAGDGKLANGHVQISEPWVWTSAADETNGQKRATVLYFGFGGGAREPVSIDNRYCAICVRRATAPHPLPGTSDIAPSVPAPTRKINISAGEAVGMLVQKTNPLYPPIARAARISGTVVLKATISKSGSIENLQVISGPPMLQQATIDAVKTWRYRPYLLNGRPVDVDTTIDVIFNLTN